MRAKVPLTDIQEHLKYNFRSFPSVFTIRCYLNFVVLVHIATVKLQLRVRVVTLVILTHPGDEGEVLRVLNPQSAREQEVHVAAVFEGEAEVVQVAQDEGVGLDRRCLDDAVENDPVSVVLKDAGGDELGAIVAAVTLANLQWKRRWTRVRRRVLNTVANGCVKGANNNNSQKANITAKNKSQKCVCPSSSPGTQLSCLHPF